MAGWRASGTTAVRSRSSFPESSLTDELQDIDKTVESLRESVRSLEFQIKQHHLRRNSLLPLFSLPPEILENIFLLVVPFPGQREALFNLGLVCSWWQAVVSRSGRLWSNVLDVNDDRFWVQTILERSAQVPFGVHARIMAPYDEDATRNLITVLQELPHIHTFDIRAHCHFIQPLVPYLNVHSPILHTFSLSAVCGDSINHLILPSSLFTPSSLNMRHFEVRRCDFDVGMLKGWRLTHLVIYDMSITARPLRNELLDTLECLPLLQELTLSGVISSNLTSPSRYTQVYLVHLQCLHLQGDFAACCDFLPWVVFPATASLDLFWSASAEIALPLINNSLMKQVLKPRLKTSGCHVLEFSALPHEVEFLFSHDAHPQALHFKYNFPSSTTTQTTPDIHDIIVALFELPFPLDHVTTWFIDMSLLSPLSQPAWFHIMSKFPVLRELSCCPVPIGLFGCLADNTARAVTGNEPLLLPDLTKITFQGVPCERPYHRALKRLRRKIKWKSP